MNLFKDIAYQILKDAGKPLHSRQITDIAKKQGLQSVGKTPEKTMEALIAVDIKKRREKSRFIRTDSSTFFINKKWDPKWEKVYKVTAKLSPKQKGDIAESRIAEIILLYGQNLSCYKPISDDEGIDIIVKNKRTEKTFFVQVKSMWRFGGVVSTNVKRSAILGRKKLGIVFCIFNTEEGEMTDFLWFVPAKDFLKKGNKLKNGLVGFVAGKSQRETNKWNDYLIDKRDLGNQIIAQMKGI